MRLLFAVLLTVGALVGRAQAEAPQGVDWPNVGNDRGGTRYSFLAQIDRSNVAQLAVAWTYHTGDAAAAAATTKATTAPVATTTIECTPVVVDGVAYVTTVKTRVVALDAATGKEIWSFDPYDGPKKEWNRASGGVNRGVAVWSGHAKKRVIVGLSDGRLLSLDTKTGKPDLDFGDRGYVDLRAGYANERDLTKLPYGPTSAPAVFENLVFVGCSNGEGHPAAPGDVRAFDMNTGKEVWRFHTIPRPGEPFGDTWEADAWKDRGGANPWSGFTIDEENGILFCGTGSAGPDFFGAGRKGNNLFANCVLALDARTGKRLWHFQTVHHDLWDNDNPCPPVVCTVKKDGRTIPAVAQVTKTGFCYLLDRKTGEPIFGVKEEPAPASDVPGEEAARTQPVPLKPPAFSRRVMNDDDATNVSPEARAAAVEMLKKYRHDGPAAPPTERGTVVIPGFHGGATWSGACFDPTSGLLYVNSNESPNVITLKRKTDYYEPTGYNYFRDGQPLPSEREKAGGQQGGYPAIKPPWGMLNAIDVSKGDFAWRTPLGEFPELAAKGIARTGTENFGGAIVTAGGLVFIGGSKDEMFHAYDAKTGELLWQTQLPAGGYATPCTYSVGGRQFVLIAAGGGGKQKTKSGDNFVAFALPKK
jgi:quinoprotein glucose dehydrogenase